MLLILVSSEAVYLINKAAEGSVEKRLLDIYEQAPLHESEAEANDTPDVALICYTAALEDLRFSPSDPHLMQGMATVRCREKRNTEGLQGMAQGIKQQTDFVGPRSDIS